MPRNFSATGFDTGKLAYSITRSSKLHSLAGSDDDLFRSSSSSSSGSSTQDYVPAGPAASSLDRSFTGWKTIQNPLSQLDDDDEEEDGDNIGNHHGLIPAEPTTTSNKKSHPQTRTRNPSFVLEIVDGANSTDFLPKSLLYSEAPPNSELKEHSAAARDKPKKFMALTDSIDSKFAQNALNALQQQPGKVMKKIVSSMQGPAPILPPQQLVSPRLFAYTPQASDATAAPSMTDMPETELLSLSFTALQDASPGATTDMQPETLTADYQRMDASSSQHPSESADTIGVRERVEDVVALLRQYGFVLMHGTAGTGKTQISTAVYSLLAGSDFQGGHYQLMDVKANVSKGKGAGDAGKRVRRRFTLRGPRTGIEDACSLLWNGATKALVVLDNISPQHLALLQCSETQAALSYGSMVLVTSRDPTGIDTWKAPIQPEVFALRPLVDEDSVKLLGYRAFGGGQVPAEMRKVVREVAGLCAGHPMALQLAGTCLKGKDAAAWSSWLRTFSEVFMAHSGGRPDYGAVLPAAISCIYDGLKLECQQALLDVAVFFVDAVNWQEVETYCSKAVLEALVASGLLQQKDNVAYLHDAVKEFCTNEAASRQGMHGRMLVVEGGKAPKAVFSKDVGGLKVLSAIIRSISKPALSHRHRILMLHNVTIKSQLPSTLVQLHWLTLEGVRGPQPKGCFGGRKEASQESVHSILEALGSMEQLRVLNIADMPFVFISLQGLRCLKMLKLHWLEHLQHLHGMEHLIFLNSLMISDCHTLTYLPKLGRVNSLARLTLNTLESLDSIPLSRLSSLTELVVNTCPEITNLDGLNALGMLESLQLVNLIKLSSLPDLSHLTMLKTVEINKCPVLTAIPGIDQLVNAYSIVLVDCWELSSLPDLSPLTSLSELTISGCVSLQGLSGLDQLKSLQRLLLGDLRTISEVPDLKLLSSLMSLQISSCHKVKSILGLQGLTSLQHLWIIDCIDLKHISSLEALTHVLEALKLDRCPELRELPGLGSLKSLTSLYICNVGVKQLEDVGNLVNLREVLVMDCDDLEYLPGLDYIPNLAILRLEGCGMLSEAGRSMDESQRGAE